MQEFIKNLKKYWKDNPKGYWFKRKLYGWGWTPVRWQGWVVILIYAAILVKIFIVIDMNQHSGSDTLINFAPWWILATIILLVIIYKTGEMPPRWQWGKEKKDE